MPDDGTGKTTLPFVIGVLADLAGTPEGKRPPVRERRFVNVGRENFDEVLRRTAPRLVLQLDAWAPPATVTLTFQRLGDFDPATVAGRVPQLTALLARRQGAADAATPDRELSARLSDILHHPEFQQLEAGWRGLRHLVGRCPEESGVRVCLYRLSKSELFRDVHTAPTPERSYLYRRAYEERLGRLGGEPIGLLVGDYTIGLADVPRLKDVARVAALLHAPFVAAAGPDFFALDQFTQLDGARDLATIFKARRYDDWNEFRREDVSRYVGLALPRVLARRPYDRDSGGATFAFEEAVTGKQHERYLWMNPAWAYAGCVADAQARHGWPAAAGGGRVEGLPVHVFATDDGDREMKCPTELGLSDRRAGELAALGFLPLVHRRNTDHAVFKDSPSCHEPRGGGAGVASRLDYLLCAARLAHHAQALARDKAGAAQTAADLDRWLNDWLAAYVLTDPTADAAERTRRPLAVARAVVRPAPGRDEGYQLTLEVSPRHAFGEVAQPPLRFTLYVSRRGK